MGNECSGPPQTTQLVDHTAVVRQNNNVVVVSTWQCATPDQIPIDIRAQPSVDGVRTGELVMPGDEFAVSQEFTTPEGILYLQLADGRGWVYVSMPGVGCLCRIVPAVPTTGEESSSISMWRCVPPVHRPVEILSVPDINGAPTGHHLEPGERFVVAQEYQAPDGMVYLRLKDGRGWAYVARLNVGIFAEPDFWKYQPLDGLHLDARTLPNLSAPKTGHVLNPMEVFCVARTYEGTDGITYLKLADGRGWAFSMKPDVGVLCIRVGEPKVEVVVEPKMEVAVVAVQPAVLDNSAELAEKARIAELARIAREDEERRLEVERRDRMEKEYRAELARMAEQVAEWQQRVEAETKAKVDAEVRASVERKAREDAEQRAQVEHAALSEAKDATERHLRAERERRAVEEAARIGAAEQKAVQEAERRADVERRAQEQAKEAEDREYLLRVEADKRAEQERKAREEAEARATSETLAALKAREEVQRNEQLSTNAEAQRKLLWETQEAARIAQEEEKKREKEEHRVLVARFAGEVSEWQRRADVEKEAKFEAERRVEEERVAREEAERRAEAEHLAVVNAKDESERLLRADAERRALEEVERLKEVEIKAKEEAERFAEVQRLAENRARDASERQLRVQAERLSFDPASVPQPSLSILGVEQQKGITTAVALDVNRDGRTDAVVVGVTQGSPLATTPALTTSWTPVSAH